MRVIVVIPGEPSADELELDACPRVGESLVFKTGNGDEVVERVVVKVAYMTAGDPRPHIFIQ